MSDLTKQPETTQQTDLLSLAIQQGANIETLEKLMALQERYQANKARASFFDALSRFQQVCPSIVKEKKVLYKTDKGQTSYNFAPLSLIVEKIKAPLSECGLTYRWEIKDLGDKLEVTCIITHREGHSEKTTMSASADSSGGKNAIQARGSSITYLERYTLTGALGISSGEADQDGHMKEMSVDELHKQYMTILDPLVQKDSKWTKFNPDNWKGERTSANYIKAIADLKSKARGVS